MIFWRYSSASLPVLGHLKGKGHCLPTSLQCRRGSSLTASVLTEPSPVNLQQCGSFATEKIELLIQTCLLGRPTSVSKITAKAQWLSTPPLLTETHPKQYFIFIFPQKNLSSVSGSLCLIRKAQAVTFKCIPATRAWKRKICAFASNG